jgi:hypothetical protein
MKPIRALLCGVVVAYAHAMTPAEQPTVVLSLEPAVTLPGSPVAFMVTVAADLNDGDEIDHQSSQ